MEGFPNGGQIADHGPISIQIVILFYPGCSPERTGKRTNRALSLYVFEPGARCRVRVLRIGVR